MANLRVHADRLEVQLSAAEKSLALRSADLVVRRDDIRSATITDDPWIWIRGIRTRGTQVPLVLAVGTWKNHGGTDFVLVKGKRQAVVLDLGAGEFTRLVLTTNHAVQLVERLRVEGTGLAAPAETIAGAEPSGAAGPAEPGAGPA